MLHSGPIGAEGSDARTHADWLLEDIIRPAMSGFPEFRLKRADEDSRPGLIDAQIIGDLLEADLVIADLSLLNPNAFYETGIRHMAQRPIIHVQLEAEEVPFDVSLYRALKFSTRQHRDVLTAQQRLRAMVKAILEPDYQISNPVTQARGQIKLAQSASPTEAVLLARMNALESALETLLAGQKTRGSTTGGTVASLGMELILKLQPEASGDAALKNIVALAEALGVRVQVETRNRHSIKLIARSMASSTLNDFRERLQEIEQLQFANHPLCVFRAMEGVDHDTLFEALGTPHGGETSASRVSPLVERQ